jgi:hypothetical protein
MPNVPEILSVTPQRLRCYICGTFSETPDRWMYRLGLTGQKPVCPACSTRAEHDIEEQAAAPNLSRAVLYGSLAALVCGGMWGASRVALACPLTGWLVGMAVIRGSGNKRGPVLQRVAAPLAAAAGCLAQYLTFNFALQRWLGFAQFLTLFGQITPQRKAFSILLIAIAAWVGYIIPRSDRLVSKLPSKARRWF